MKKEVATKFPSEVSLVTSYFFLRYICPALTQPTVYNLLMGKAIIFFLVIVINLYAEFNIETPTTNQRAILVQLGKCMQWLANDTVLNEGIANYKIYNAFIQENRPKIKDFLEKLLV
jgi:hypothetical protein